MCRLVIVLPLSFGFLSCALCFLGTVYGSPWTDAYVLDMFLSPMDLYLLCAFVLFLICDLRYLTTYNDPATCLLSFYPSYRVFFLHVVVVACRRVLHVFPTGVAMTFLPTVSTNVGSFTP